MSSQSPLPVKQPWTSPAKGKLRARRKGSIMLLTLMLTGTVAMLSATFSNSVRTQMNLARDTNLALKAELSATSGLEIARRRLSLYPAWTGTSNSGIEVTNLGTYIIDRLDTQNDYWQNHVAEFEIEGVSGDGKFRMETNIEVEPGDMLRTKSFIGLGGNMNMHNCSYTGDLCVPDKIGIVWDWDSTMNGGLGGWLPAPLGSAPNLTFSSADLNGWLFKFTNTVHINSLQEMELQTQPLYMPGWNLDEYQVPGNGLVIFNGVTSLTNVSHTDTVVFILNQGDSLTLEDCTFSGGLVIYAEPNYDLRGPARNTVTFRKATVIGDGDQGYHPNLGLVAPAAEIRDSSVLSTTIDGFSFVYDIDSVSQLTVSGQMIVVNQVDVNTSSFQFEEAVAENPPPGITYGGPMPYIDVQEVLESYDPFTPPEGFGY